MSDKDDFLLEEFSSLIKDISTDVSKTLLENIVVNEIRESSSNLSELSVNIKHLEGLLENQIQKLEANNQVYTNSIKILAGTLTKINDSMIKFSNDLQSIGEAEERRMALQIEHLEGIEEVSIELKDKVDRLRQDIVSMQEWVGQELLNYSDDWKAELEKVKEKTEEGNTQNYKLLTTLIITVLVNLTLVLYIIFELARGN